MSLIGTIRPSRFGQIDIIGTHGTVITPITVILFIGRILLCMAVLPITVHGDTVTTIMAMAMLMVAAPVDNLVLSTNADNLVEDIQLSQDHVRFGQARFQLGHDPLVQH